MKNSKDLVARQMELSSAAEAAQASPGGLLPKAEQERRGAYLRRISSAQVSAMETQLPIHHAKQSVGALRGETSACHQERTPHQKPPAALHVEQHNRQEPQQRVLISSQKNSYKYLRLFFVWSTAFILGGHLLLNTWAYVLYNPPSFIELNTVPYEIAVQIVNCGPNSDVENVWTCDK